MRHDEGSWCPISEAVASKTSSSIDSMSSACQLPLLGSLIVIYDASEPVAATRITACITNVVELDGRRVLQSCRRCYRIGAPGYCKCVVDSVSPKIVMLAG